MEMHDVVRILRGVIDDLAAPFTVVDVERTSAGWQARLKAAAPRRVVILSLPDGPPPAMRAAATHTIETYLNANT